MIGSFWLVSSILFFILTAIGTGLCAIWGKKASFVDPILQFLFFFSLFVLPLPIRSCFTRFIDGDVTEHLDRIIHYMPLCVFICAIGIPLFYLAYYSDLARRLSLLAPIPKTGTHSRLACLGITTISAFLIMLLVGREGLTNFLLLGYNSTRESYGKGYLWIGFAWLPVASLFLLYRYAVKREKVDLVLFLAMSSILVLMDLVLGSRFQIVYFGLAVWVFWHHAVRPISMRKLVVFGVVSFAALNLVGVLRESNYEDLSDVWTKASKGIEKQSDRPDSFFYTLTVGEFVVPFETFPEMVRSVGKDVSPQLGLTYLEAPLLWIPSVVYPQRPLPLTTWYMRRFYGDSYGINEGRSFFFLSEGYLNFGLPGAVATMLAWGFLFGAVNAYIRRARGEPGAVLLCALTIAFIFRAISGDFASFAVSLPSQSLAIAIVGLWICNRRIIGPSPTRVRLSAAAVTRGSNRSC